MNEIDGVVTFGAWLPDTERGKMIPVTAEPPTVVPGDASNGPGGPVTSA